MTAKAKVMMLVKQANEIMHEEYQMRVNNGKVLFYLEGTKNMQTRMHKELNKWYDRCTKMKLNNKLSEEEFLLRQKIYYSIFYSINGMTIE